MILCEYGCGQEAKYQFKNGKWCCSGHQTSCPRIREKKSENRKGGVPLGKTWKEVYGEEKALEIKKKSSASHRGKSNRHTKESRKKISERRRGKGLGPQSKDTIRRRSEAMKGKNTKPKSKDHIEKIRNFRKGKTYEELYGEERAKVVKEKSRQRLLNGQASYMNKFIKNPSKQELQLREIILNLYPDAQPQYKILNYSIDIALVKDKVAIEYDGWYHFDCQHDIDYHKKRQQEIENEGWKFLRYNIFQKFPSKEQLKRDIEEILKC